MSEQQVHPLLTPWQASDQTNTPLIDNNISPQKTSTTTWQVRKPTFPGDLRSTSTVTTSESPSSSSSSSPHSSNSAHPVSTNNHPATKWGLDEFDDQIPTPPTSPPPNHTASVRTLPRCGVVNFRKDGDNLRWAPRVTQNSSGVAARVHNFEDAFSLEEFSSRALPIVWRSRGGNPRLSDFSQSEDAHQSRPVRGTKSVPHGSQNTLPPPRQSPFPTNPAQTIEKDTTSMGHSERAFVRNSSVQKAVVIASEVTRPSFWSLLVHTNKYQRTRAKARLEHKTKKRAEKTAKRSVPRPNLAADPDPPNENQDPAVFDEAQDVLVRKPWVSLPGWKNQKSSQSGKGKKRTTEAGGKKKAPLLQRLLSHVDRRKAKKQSSKPTPTPNTIPRTQPAQKNRMAFPPSASTSDSEDRPGPQEIQKRIFRQPRHSDGQTNRRVVSALAANLPPLKPPRRELTRVASQNDQYVTFITSES